MYRLLVQSWVFSGVDATPALDVQIIEFKTKEEANSAWERIFKMGKELALHGFNNRIFPVKLYSE